RRRELQRAYNDAHGITPESIKSSIRELLQTVYERDYYTVPVEEATAETFESPAALQARIGELEARMKEAAKRLDFEQAAQIRDLEYIATDNELEALMLEANLVRRHRPRYNIILRDDKHYPFLKLTTNEEFPRLVVARKVQHDGARYFGPFYPATAMRETLR